LHQFACIPFINIPDNDNNIHKNNIIPSGIDQEKAGGSLSVIGVIFGVCASACVALNAIFTKRTLPVVGDNIWLLQFYNNFNATLLFIPLMFLNGEFPVLAAFDNLFSAHFMIMCSAAGICGFSIGIASG
jgi:GDP-fucose transporter C1